MRGQASCKRQRLHRLIQTFLLHVCWRRWRSWAARRMGVEQRRFAIDSPGTSIFILRRRHLYERGVDRACQFARDAHLCKMVRWRTGRGERNSRRCNDMCSHAAAARGKLSKKINNFIESRTHTHTGPHRDTYVRTDARKRARTHTHTRITGY